MKNFRSSILKRLFLLAFVYSAGSLSAQINASYTVNIENPAFQLDHKVNSAKLYVKFAAVSAAGDYYYGNNDFEASLNIEVKAYDQENQLISGVFTNSGPFPLSINTEKPEVVFYKEFSPWMNNSTPIAKFEILVTNLTSSSPVLEISSALLNDLKLVPDYKIDYAVDVKQNGAAQVIEIINLASRVASPLPSPVTQRIVEFTWDTKGHIFPNYQFQLLKLNNTNPANTSDEEVIEAKIDWSKALTIETGSSDPSLSLFIAEGTGYYAWRVRPLGSYYPGGAAIDKNWGTWSNVTSNNAIDGSAVSLPVISLNAELSSSGSATYPLFFFRDPDEGRNWIYSRSFSEGNKTAEQITYANGLLQSKQSQAYLPDKDAVIITQTVTDRSGRPALNTLPVPVQNQKLTGYKQNLVQNSSGQLYTASDFDLDANFQNPGTVNDAGTGFSYYNGTYYDTEGNVPGAEGYAFSRNLFYDDGTGRVKEMAGPGKRHALGGQASDMGRTVRTLYVTPSDAELIRIFGDEAPAASSVLKTITVDANNSTSVTYTGGGRMIATCIAVNATENPALASLSEPALQMTVDDITSQNVPGEAGFVSIKRLAFTEASTITLDYMLDCPSLTSNCGSAECTYDLKVIVKDINDLTNTNTNRTFTQKVTTVNCGTYLSSFLHEDGTSKPIALNLPAGTYIIEKVLTPTGDVNAISASASGDAGDEIKPYVDLVKSWLSSVSTPAQMAEFYEKLNAFPNISQADKDEFFGGNTPPTGVMSVTPGAPATPEILHLNTACCPNMQVPLDFTAAFSCPSNLSDLAEYANGKSMDFEGYLGKILQENYGIILDNITYPTILPGYAAGEFNKMVYYMLNEKYSCTPGGIAQVQYTCDQLWQCWINVVSGYKDMLDGLNGNYSVEKGKNGGGDGTDAEDGNPLDPQQTSFEKVFDENNDGILNHIVGALMGAYMRGKNLNIDFEYNIAKQFLECTGYRFAEILVDGVSPTLTDEYGTVPTHSNLLNGSGDPMYPFIEKPMYAFKYFTYTTGTNEACENIHCFTANPAATPPDPCKPITCPEGYKSWNCTQRGDFYKCLLGNTGDITPAADATPPACPTELELQALAAQKTESCTTRCEERRNEFRETVINMFLERCYTIGGCATDPNNVPLSDIDAIVNQIYTECADNCYISPPVCDTITCGSTVFLDIKYIECELMNRERAMTGKVELDVQSKCAGAPLFNCTTTTNNCTPGAEPSKQISVSVTGP